MLERRLIAVEGTVQGVGFRPYVHRLAAARALHGFVRNDAGQVFIDIEGEVAPLDAFCADLTAAPPVMSTITRVQMLRATPLRRNEFRIVPSTPRRMETAVPSFPPDVAACDECVAELFDNTNRRFGHAFISCTNCGPRYTAMYGLPYDRERTHMAAFAPCAACWREYHDARDRRFHAEAIACPKCGPTLVAFATADSTAQVSDEGALALAVSTLRNSGIVAIKALGGFHLACSAADETAVQQLRHRKRRQAKPFAVMVRGASEAHSLCEVSAGELVALESPARPVVLMARRAAGMLAASVARRSTTLGLMLPSTPLHHLLLGAFNGPLVMTSGNHSDEPVATNDRHAEAALRDIADVFLTHDRDIAVRADDSVVRVGLSEARVLRRARGYAPKIIVLPRTAPTPVLAVGGHLKNTVCVALDRQAHLSAHIGDLHTAAAREAHSLTARALLRTVGVQPAAIAHDLHPDYASTRFAELFATENQISQRVPVQHHHAHVAACVAEHGVTEPVIGVVFDGAGLGMDGAIWGGEFLLADGARFSRLGHLAYVPLPGGDAAARHPWRSAAAHVARVSTDEPQAARARPAFVGDNDWQMVRHLIQQTAGTHQTSSVGRLFDAVASLLNLCHEAQFEGQAAMALEEAAKGRMALSYSVTLTDDHCFTAEPGGIMTGVLHDIARGRNSSEISAAFHASLCQLIVLGSERSRAVTGVEIVVLSGGVFVNAVLSGLAESALLKRGFRVLVPRNVPCNDGGLALGQAYVAACALEDELCA